MKIKLYKLLHFFNINYIKYCMFFPHIQNKTKTYTYFPSYRLSQSVSLSYVKCSSSEAVCEKQDQFLGQPFIGSTQIVRNLQFIYLFLGQGWEQRLQKVVSGGCPHSLCKMEKVIVAVRTNCSMSFKNKSYTIVRICFALHLIQLKTNLFN